MHELSIAQALIEEIHRAAGAEGATRVTRVTLSIGQLSGVNPEALEMAFPFAAEGTLAAEATLEIEDVPARVFCRACRQTSSPEFPFFVCEQCGSSDVEVRSGHELNLKSLELES